MKQQTLISCHITLDLVVCTVWKNNVAKKCSVELRKNFPIGIYKNQSYLSITKSYISKLLESEGEF